MLLTVDIGNSALKWAAFDGARLVRAARCASADAIDFGRRVDAVAVATVVPDRAEAALAALGARFGVAPVLVGRHFRVPIDVTCRRPGDVGTDRLLNALAAFHTIGGRCVAVDVGSAITVDAVDDAGAFAGGAIAPGPALAALSLHEHTALLPHTTPGVARRAVGRDTEEAIRSGIYHGCRGAVRELVDRIRDEFGGGDVIATGGFAAWLEDMDCITRTEPYLTLHGLRLAWRAASSD